MPLAMLETTAQALVAPRKGILAADESHGTIGRRFEVHGISNSEENRRRYRQMLFVTKGIAEFISGVILFDETIRQSADDGRLFVEVLAEAGIIAGIKVDHGAKPLAGAPGERVTEGLDGLRERLAEYKERGAQFAKWRAVIAIDGNSLPTHQGLEANVHALARYAALCQAEGLVPIVEPEVLMDGDHSIQRCLEVTETTLARLFEALRGQRVVLEHVLLKPNMVVPGARSTQQASVAAVAEATVRCLRRVVPAAVPGIVFLSGGQDAQVATAHLNAMNAMALAHPWPLSFSFARALQSPALEAWRGESRNVPAGQRAFYHRARCNSAAREGRYTAELEQAPVPGLRA